MIEKEIEMDRVDYILDFTARLAREMLECGANLERVNLNIESICKSYGLREVTVFSLNSYIKVSAREIGKSARSRCISVPINGIHLEKLSILNNLSRTICREKPEPEKLEDILFEALMVPGYSAGVTLLGYLLAMSCLCAIFGGGIRDILIADFSTTLLYYVFAYFARLKMNRIITNTICMFLAGTVALVAYRFGFAVNFYAIIITNAFYLIPGIPMVNATRNLLCGNEMNGIIELVKVVLEVVTIVLGLYLACCLLGRDIPFV